MSLEKKLKVKDGIEGKVLTVDANGVMTSSNKDVDDIASANELGNVTERVATNETNISNLDGRVGTNETDISNLDTRVTTLEGAVDEMMSQVESINGEVVE